MAAVICYEREHHKYPFPEGHGTTVTCYNDRAVQQPVSEWME